MPAGGGGKFAAVDESGAARQVAEEDVLRHAHLGHEVQFLIDDRDARRERGGGIAECLGAAPEGQPAGGRAVRAAQNLEQRGLAGAIFTHERMDRAGVHVEGDIRQRLDAGELHGGAVEREGGGTSLERIAGGMVPALTRRATGQSRMPCSCRTWRKLARVIRTPMVRVSRGGSTPSLIHLYIISAVW